MFSDKGGSVFAGFGICSSCIGEDIKSMNKPSERDLNDLKLREFSDVEYENKLNSIRIDELIDLKEKYDKAFVKYWSAGRDLPKFQRVSLERFIERLRNIDFFEKHGKDHK
jgi:hypothetical protein